MAEEAPVPLDDEVDEDEEEGRQPSQVGPRTPAVLFDRYHVNADAPLTGLDSPSARAYAVTDRRDPGRKLFALVCMPGLPTRTTVMSILKAEQPRGVLPLVEWGTVFWPPLGQACMAVVYERPAGGRLSEAFAQERINEFDVPRRIIEPVVQALHELSGRGVAHRAIRLNNLFFMDAGRQVLVLGDCVTAPPGFDQPLVYESLPRALAAAGGRGVGDMGDDTYALGVTVVSLLLGREPAARVGPDDLLVAKVEQGTYAALCGNERLPMSMIEPLRGLLHDDDNERWRLEQLDLWLSGRRMTPSGKRAVPRADTPMNFAGRNHLTARTLAWFLCRNVADGARVIRGGHVETWVRRSLNNADLADQIAEAVEAAEAHENDYMGSNDYLVTKIAILLDPRAPITYRGMSFMLEGFGAAVAVERLRRDDVQIPGEFIARGFATIWLDAQTGPKMGFANLERIFAQLRAYLQIQDPGYGIERCLYELNPSLPCQSPLVIRDYVIDLADLLPALDEAANRVDARTKPVDRHIAAFIAAHFSQDVDAHLKAAASDDEAESVIAMLSLLASLQLRYKTPGVLGLASWIGGLLGPAIGTYHNRATRREIEREIPRLVRQGGLTEMFDLIENTEKRRRDEHGFRTAVAEFAAADAEIQEVESGDVARSETGERQGQQAAAMTSVVIALIVVSVVIMVEIM